MRRIAEWIFGLDIAASDRLVLFALCRSVGCGDSEVEASIGDIRSSTSLASNTVRKSINRLLALGHIQRPGGNLGGRKPRYIIRLNPTKIGMVTEINPTKIGTLEESNPTKIGTPTKIDTTKIGMVQEGDENNDQNMTEFGSPISIPIIKGSIESIESIETEQPFSSTISILRTIEGYNLTFEKEQGLISWLETKKYSTGVAEESANAMYMNLSVHHANDGSKSWTYRKSGTGRKSGYYKTLDGVFRAWVAKRMRDAPTNYSTKQGADPSEVFKRMREERQ